MVKIEEEKRSSATERKVARLDPGDIRRAIFLIDAYRSHLFYDVSSVDRAVTKGTLGRTFGENWKEFRKNLVKMASVTATIPGLTKLAKWQYRTEALWQIAVPVMFITMFLGLLAPSLPMATLSPYVVIVAMSSLLVGLISRFFLGQRIGRRIEAYFVDKPEAHKIRMVVLKEGVQVLLDELRTYLRHTGEEPKKHLVGVGMTDYIGIEIHKRPRPWRKYFLVSLAVY